MTIAYILTPELRIKLKDPFGNLIQGTSEETMTKMKEMVEKEKPSKIISVGDIVSRNLHKHNIHPQLTIIDNISLRDQPILKEDGVEKTVNVDNPQGTITQEAIFAIKKALESNEHTHIVVKGRGRFAYAYSGFVCARKCFRGLWAALFRYCGCQSNI